jgi:hypothetical protein
MPHAMNRGLLHRVAAVHGEGAANNETGARGDARKRTASAICLRPVDSDCQAVSFTDAAFQEL